MSNKRQEVLIARVTMREVARAAGLSQPAVSMALRRHPRIAPATCDRVIALAWKLGYRPHPMVSALMAQLHGRRRGDQSPVLGVVNASPRRRDLWNAPGLFREFRRGAEERAAELGFILEEFRLGQDGMDRRQLERVLAARGVAGLLIAPLPETGWLDLSWPHYALATLGDSLQEPRLHRAAVHQYANAWKLLEGLRERGAGPVALVQSHLMSGRIQHAWLGAYAAWAQVHPDLAAGSLLFESGDCAAIVHWLRGAAPRALVLHEEEGMAAVRKLPARQRPRLYDLGVVRRSDLPQKGIDPQRAVIGAAMVDQVVAQLNRNERGVPAVPKVVLIEGRLVL